jgi:metallo-beta-lactamase class B
MHRGVVTLLLFGATVSAQSGGTVESHVGAAKALAAAAPTPLINLCTPEQASRATAPARRGGQPPAAQATQAPPARTAWAREPMKVFDNLYYVGEKDFSAWAVTTSAGIIIIDAIYDYSVEEQIAGGLKKLGLDPSQIKYVVISHAHRDHVGGAWYLQERFGARVMMTAADWDLLERNTQKWPKAKRDIVVTDGQQLTLGDTTLTFIHTPGHTPGTMSTLVPVKDNGTPHVAALWGGTGFNFTITPDRPASYWFDEYIKSAERFRAAAAKAGADVFLSNHPSWDGSNAKMAAMANRAPGAPHPYVVGAKTVQNYLTVAEHCARAGKLRLAN